MSVGLSGLERSLNMHGVPARALLRASLAGLCVTATKCHKKQTTLIHIKGEDFCQSQG